MNDVELVSLDSPGKLEFFGTFAAELFTKEIEESVRAVLHKNYMSVFERENAGFVSASVDGRPWTGTMWTRDAGVFLRELVHYGYYGHACLTADCLIRLVEKNEDGYFTFPDHFDLGKPASGSELDGTSAIIIGMVLLWQRLPVGHPSKTLVYSFLHDSDSPLFYIDKVLKSHPLVPGSGEFGGGCGIGGLYMNVVQNYLIYLALAAAAKMEKEAGDKKTASLHEKNAENLLDGIEKHLVGEDGAWIWCIKPDTLKPDPEIINHIINRGFGGINGPACMSCDVLGLESLAPKGRITDACIKTFEKLYSFPLRKEQFEKYGLWTLFDEYLGGYNGGPSYGQGYAIMTMLLLDWMEMADRALCYFAEAVFRPPSVFPMDRQNPYWIYERFISPDAEGKTKWDEGCGALNLVCVAEPMKIARMIAGIDDTQADAVTIIPRVPPSWSGYEAKNWPIRTGEGLVRADIRYEKDAFLRIEVRSGRQIPHLKLKLGTAQKRKTIERRNVKSVDIRP